MKAYLISDNRDTIVGMRFAGISGCIVSSKKEAEDALLQAAADKENAILFVTEKAAAFAPDVIRQLRKASELPLVVEIPDRHGTMRDENYLTKYVQEAIGVKM